MSEKKQGIKNFFYPKTIAIIGASENPLKVGNVLMKKMLKFKGELIPVNIKDGFIEGKKAYATIKDYSEKIDLAVIATPAETVAELLEECGKKGIKNVIIISAGFAESGNIEAEKKLLNIAKKYDLNLIGPNCFGVENPYVNLDLTFSNSDTKKGDIAFISQSGAAWSSISDFDIGFSGFVSLGNMADLTFHDFLNYFCKDKNTKKIVLYIEKIKNGKEFLKACKKCKKEIIAIKAGRTQTGVKATMSHTGSLATDFEIYKGAFKQAGIKLMDSMSEALGKGREEIPILGKKAYIITNAGGPGALITDYLEEKGVSVVNSPIDLLGTALASDYKNALEKIKNENFYDFIIVILTPQKMSQTEETARIIVEFSKQTKKKIIACFLGEKSIKEAKKILEQNNIICLTHCC